MEIRGKGDGETGRNGEGETREHRDDLTADYHDSYTRDRISVSPCPRISVSLDPPISASPSPRVPASPRRLVLRLGLKYVKGLSASSGQTIERERQVSPFLSFDDLRNRVPELRRDELRKLAAVGALNFIRESPRSKVQHPTSTTRNAAQTLEVGLWTLDQGINRRDALWQVERVSRPAGPLYQDLHDLDGKSPLAPMTLPEKLDADFRGTGLTIGRHPVAHHRSELNKLGASRAIDISALHNGSSVRVAGWVIVRQRPGTAKGFVFLTLEDETGVANIIVTPQLFTKNRLVLVDHPFLLIEGILQNQDRVVSVKAKRVRPLSFKVAGTPSHDFH
jgi:error-prone DNA polymerase